jgi:uncharacterized protein YdcH (DUF465 family)
MTPLAGCIKRPGAAAASIAVSFCQGFLMDTATIEQIARMPRSDPRIESLVERHTVLEERIRVLFVRDHLTPSESVELARLKKEKLGVKDEIESLLHSKSA